ncbi:MAG: cob(I)yrinic acid a,c-diamide adenosyltransferase, partial [FCB group bacterium]|nr:cob(I)yrinic acid a,c-diamide adenosyltransferase [FCB group bacterium]
MTEEKFKDPEISINRVYTKTGDGGKTRLAGGQLLNKDHIRIQSYGEVDELNACVGLCRQEIYSLTDQFPELAALSASLLRIQHELFNLGSQLATLPEDRYEKMPVILSQDIQQLESEIDSANSILNPLKSFVLPGGSELNARLHLARTICRRAERTAVSLDKTEPGDQLPIQYLNRLSDA